MARTSSYLSHLKVQRRLPILLMKSAMNLTMILSGLQRSTAWQLQKDDQWSRGQLARGRTSDLLPTLRTKKKGRNNRMLKPPDVTGTRKRPKHATLKLKSPYFLARNNRMLKPPDVTGT